MQSFQLSQDQARAWIGAFAEEGAIIEVDWTSPSKNKSKVWTLPGDAQP
jgi:hypothetical protein